MIRILAKAIVGIIVLTSFFDLSAQTTKKPQPQKSQTQKQGQKSSGQKKTVQKPQPVPVDGFWLVTKVTVGAKELTPIARWFKLDAGKQVSGNGWLQHSYGTYKFDKKKSELLFITENEPDDEFGAFKVVRTGATMSWSRTEERELVVVELKPITELPKSPADEVKGLWVLESALNRDVNITKQYDPDRQHFLFIRWDRQYVRQINSRERISGYWSFDAYQPVITLISEHREQQDEQWSASVSGTKLVMKGVTENVANLVLTYKRATDFPK